MLAVFSVWPSGFAPYRAILNVSLLNSGLTADGKLSQEYFFGIVCASVFHQESKTDDNNSSLLAIFILNIVLKFSKLDINAMPLFNSFSDPLEAAGYKLIYFGRQSCKAGKIKGDKNSAEKSNF